MKSPAELFFARHLREPDLAELPPKLDLSENHEAVLNKKLQNSQKSQSRREHDVLNIGQRVLVQDPISSTWREAATVVAIDPTCERSYEVKRDGRAQTIRRNRIHLRPMSLAKEGDDDDETDAGAKKATGRAKSSGGGGSLPSSEPPTALRRSERLRDCARKPIYK